MKRILIFTILAAVAMAFKAPNAYKVDVNASIVQWMGYKVTGSHTGTVKLKSGSLEYDNGQLKGASFDIDMTTIRCTDMEGDMASKLVGHLSSDDFFGVATYPTATFTLTRAIPQDSKGNYKLIGNLRIKETTKEIKFMANIMEKDGRITASGKMTIDRSDYNVRYGSGSFFDNLGDKTIYDEFDIQFNLVAKK